MKNLAAILALFVAAEHFYIMYLEMFKIPSVAAGRIFGLPEEFMQQKRVQALFSNQGLYNGFLAAGLLWTFFISDEIWSRNIALFFLNCVLVAAIYGAYSVSKKIFYVQGLPAIIGILSLFL